MGGKDPEKQNGQSKVATEQAGLQGGGEDEGEEEVEEKERRRRRRNRDRDRDMDMDMDIRGFCKGSYGLVRWNQAMIYIDFFSHRWCNVPECASINNAKSQGYMPKICQEEVNSLSPARSGAGPPITGGGVLGPTALV